MTARLCLLLCFTAACGGRASGAERKPNLLIIVADQWRAQAFGFAGDPNVKTPNLDRLAAASVSVTNAISGCPVCSPFRASLLTGQRPLTHGVFVNDVPLSPNAITLAKVLKNTGWDTGAIGKWHVDGHGRSAFIPPERRQGFDYWKAMECTHDYNHSAYFGDTPEKQFWKGYDAFAQTEDAARYIREHAHRPKPFFLLLAWGPPHNPYETAPEGFRRLYRAEDIQLRPNVPGSAAAQARKDLAGYYAHCAALDKCVGKLWQVLVETGVERDTILVFTSDHGDMLGSQGNERKQRPWDESIRIPLLIHYPAGLGEHGQVSSALINAEDLMPTFLGLCAPNTEHGIPEHGVPASAGQFPLIPTAMEGFDYSKFLRTGSGPVPDAALLSCVAPFGEWTRKLGGREYRGIRTGRYTYVRDLNGPWLLYDNERDPYQTTNLCNQPEAHALQAQLDKVLKDKLRASGDEFLPAETYMKKWGYTIDEHGRTAKAALAQRSHQPGPLHVRHPSALCLGAVFLLSALAQSPH
jgi:arylsulfatase A-like enzyme